MTSIHDQPVYFLAEASRYLRMPVSTVRSWSVGRSGVTNSPPLIVAADIKTPLLSFTNLVELHVLGSLRKVHGLSPKPVRKALTFLKRELGVERPLLDQAMLTDGTNLFIERVGQLMNVSQGGQLHLKSLLGVYLRRIERDRKGLLLRFFPFTRSAVEAPDSPALIAIDPVVRAGRPCIAGTRIPTEIIASRHRAGESVKFLASDYDRRDEEIEEALRYESRTAA